MSYSLETTKKFDKSISKLGSYTQRIIKSWIVKNLVGCEPPDNKAKV